MGYPDFTLRQLAYFVAIADHRSFHKAAAACHVSQPSLSAQLQVLEQALGVTLIERSRLTVTVTPAGEPILAQARLVLAEAGSLATMAETAAEGGLSGRIRLGINKTLGPYVLPVMMPKLRDHHPKARLLPREEHPDQALAMLREGRLDLVMAAPPFDESGLEVVTVFEEPLVLALAADDPRGQADTVPEAALKDTRMLLLATGFRLRTLATELCLRVGAIPDDAFEGTSLTMLRQMVSAGQGVALMTGLYAVAEGRLDPGVRLRPLEPAQSRPVAMAWRRAAPQRQAYREVAALIGETCRSALEDLPSALREPAPTVGPSQKPFWTSAS